MKKTEIKKFSKFYSNFLLDKLFVALEVGEVVEAGAEDGAKEGQEERDPEVVAVDGEDFRAVHDGGEAARGKVAEGVDAEAGHGAKAHADAAQGQSDDDGPDGRVDLGALVGHGHDRHHQEHGADNLSQSTLTISRKGTRISGPDSSSRRRWIVITTRNSQIRINLINWA